MKKILAPALILMSMFAMAQSTVLINNVQIFNGKDEKVTIGNVLIVNNLISKISTAPIPTNKSGNTTVIDGGGKFLMPGLIDNHAHLAINTAIMRRYLILSGLRIPTWGKLGELTEGAYADMILVDGNPIKNIDLLADFEKNFVLIVKNGVVYKNSIK